MKLQSMPKIAIPIKMDERKYPKLRAEIYVHLRRLPCMKLRKEDSRFRIAI
jgi:hypothetical protein